MIFPLSNPVRLAQPGVRFRGSIDTSQVRLQEPGAADGQVEIRQWGWRE